MVIWSGKGYLVAVIVFLCSLGMEYATESFTGDSEFYQRSAWPLPLALLTAAALTLVVELLWISESERNLNSLFFIPMLWWSVILALLALGVFIYGVFATDPAPQLID